MSGGDEVRVRFWTDSRATPFRVERTLGLREGEAELVIEGTVNNRSAEAAHFVWGHHCVVGPPFLEPGCRLEIPARTIVTTPELWEPETARLEPGRRVPWPLAPLRDGGTVDLREIPGPETGSHDDLYVTDLDEGWLSVSNPRLSLGFRLEWDHELFRLDRPLAALRWRGRATARRLLRPRDRALDEQLESRAVRCRRGWRRSSQGARRSRRPCGRACSQSERPVAASKRCARSASMPSTSRSPGEACVRGSRRATSAPPSSHLALARLLRLDPVGTEVEECLGAELLGELDRHRKLASRWCRLRPDAYRRSARAEGRGERHRCSAPSRARRARRQLQPVGRELERTTREAGPQEVHRGTADERRDERVRRSVVELARCIDLLDHAAVEHRDPLAERHRLGLVVRDVQRRHPEPLMQLHELGAHLHAQLRVEVRERLVHQERRRVANDRAAHGHALALAARERPGLALEQLADPEQARPPPRPAASARASGGSASAAETRCCRGPSCAGTARSSGTPSPCRGRRGRDR